MDIQEILARKAAGEFGDEVAAALIQHEVASTKQTSDDEDRARDFALEQWKLVRSNVDSRAGARLQLVLTAYSIAGTLAGAVFGLVQIAGSHAGLAALALPIVFGAFWYASTIDFAKIKQDQTWLQAREEELQVELPAWLTSTGFQFHETYNATAKSTGTKKKITALWVVGMLMLLGFTAFMVISSI